MDRRRRIWHNAEAVNAEFKTRVQTLPFCALLAVSLYGAGFWIVEPLGLPEDDDWRAAEAAVRNGWQPGDALLVRPWWAGRVREYLGDLDLFQYRRPEGEDWAEYRRLWVLSLPGHHRDLSGPFADGRFKLESDESFGPLRLRRFFLGEPVEVVFDFRRQLERARVQMLWPEGAKPCSGWKENRWVCTPRDWNYVGRMIVELEDDPRPVIWAHPAEVPISITYADVPGGKTLKLYTGFTPPAARAKDGMPVTVQVNIDGRELGRVVQENRSGYFPSEWDISGFGPGPHEITLLVSTTNIGMRHFVFAGQVRR